MKARRSSIPRPNAAQVAGFTLLEVLVAIVVLSFGVLGMVGLQAAALQSNKEARYQASAARFERELADMMRGNKDIAALPAAANNPYLVDYTGADLATLTEDCRSTCSSPTNVARWQMRDWLYRVRDELPGVHVRVCYDAAPYETSGPYVGRPRWDCLATGAGGIAVVKMGWTRRNTKGDAMVRGADAAASAGEAAASPLVVMPLLPN